MDRNNYYHFNFFPLVFEILGKFLGPMNILLILGSATENVVVLCRVHGLYWFQSYYMYSKYNCNGKFQVSAINLISATLSFIFFLNNKAIKVSILATKTSHILASMHLSMFSPREVGWQDSHGKLDIFEALGVQNPLGGQFIKLVI